MKLKKHFSGWNFVINALIALIPASLVIGILRELGIRGGLVTVGIIFGFTYLTGLIREKINKKGKNNVTMEDSIKDDFYENQNNIAKYNPKSKKKKWIIIILVSVVAVTILIILNNQQNLSEEKLTLPKTDKGEILPLSNIDLKSGWQRIYIKNVGNIDIPPTMEVQAGTYKEFVDAAKKIMGIEVSELVVQQKGLNELNQEAIQRYSRILLHTTIGKPGDYEKINFNIKKYMEQDTQTESHIKEELNQSLSKMNTKIVQWNFIKLKMINGMSCIHAQYVRQLNNNPPVLVNSYKFFNFDREHDLIMSYRLTEENYWKDDFDKILLTFRITNIK